MRLTRIYQPVALSLEQIFSLTAEAANHLIKVLRLQVDDKFVVFDGKGNEYLARIVALKKQSVTAQVSEIRNVSLESPLQIHLGQAISRGEKMDFSLQKAVELGVYEITPLITERCGVKLSNERWDKKYQHWLGIIISACEQSGRNLLPKLHQPIAITDWLPTIHAQTKIILHPHCSKKLNQIVEQPKTVALAIGPEGGFNDQEIKYAEQHHFIPLQLGPRILRTETAGLAAIATLQAKYGDLS